MSVIIWTVDAEGVGRSVSVSQTAVTSPGSYSIDTQNIPDGSLLSPARIEGLKGIAITFQLTSTASDPVFVFEEVGVQLQFGYALVPHAVKDVGMLTDTIDRYRTTVQSGLASYMGNQLTAAGQVSSVLYRGGVNAWANGLYLTEDIAELPASYNGTAFDGSYGYWEALDREDMAFIKPASHREHVRPYLIFSFTMTDSTVGDADLRLRVVTGFEFVSTAQYYDIRCEHPNREMVESAALILAGVPNVMPNGSHSKILNSIFKKLKPGIKKAAKWGWDHRDEIASSIAKLTAMVF